jgi:hypothetical protein
MVDVSGQRISTPGLPGVVVRMASLLTLPTYARHPSVIKAFVAAMTACRHTNALIT